MAGRIVDDYRDIYGYFGYEEFFDRHVELAPDKAVFVEIGCFLGKSTFYLCDKIKESGKDITLFCVDTWLGMSNDNGEDANLNKTIKTLGGSAFPTFIANLSIHHNIIRPIVGTSWKAAELFDTASVDFTFIDAGHQYYEVKYDIGSWSSKIKTGGYICGHDYGNLGQNDPVKRAVDEYSNNVKVYGNCWEVLKER